jgi:hypothetical protein
MDITSNTFYKCTATFWTHCVNIYVNRLSAGVGSCDGGGHKTLHRCGVMKSTSLLSLSSLKFKMCIWNSDFFCVLYFVECKYKLNPRKTPLHIRDDADHWRSGLRGWHCSGGLRFTSQHGDQLFCLRLSTDSWSWSRHYFRLGTELFLIPIFQFLIFCSFCSGIYSIVK